MQWFIVIALIVVCAVIRLKEEGPALIDRSHVPQVTTVEVTLDDSKSLQEARTDDGERSFLGPCEKNVKMNLHFVGNKQMVRVTYYYWGTDMLGGGIVTKYEYYDRYGRKVYVQNVR